MYSYFLGGNTVTWSGHLYLRFLDYFILPGGNTASCSEAQLMVPEMNAKPESSVSGYQL